MTETLDKQTGELTVAHVAVPAVPFFEGKPVDGCSLSLLKSSALDLPDVVLQMDDIIQIVVEARVVGVSHVVHEPTGRMHRLQTARPLAAYLQPYGDDDDGVVRG